MKKILSFGIAFVIVAAIGTAVLMLTGRFEWREAAVVGISMSVAGIAAPIVVAWIDKLLHRKGRCDGK